MSRRTPTAVVRHVPGFPSIRQITDSIPISERQSVQLKWRLRQPLPIRAIARIRVSCVAVLHVPAEDSTMYVHYVILQLLLLTASVAGQQWPACSAGSLLHQQQAGGRVITISDPSACTLSISSGGSSSSNGSTAAGSEPQLVLVLGAQNCSLGRPNAVQLVAAPAGAAGAVDLAAGAPHDGLGTAADPLCHGPRFAPGQHMLWLSTQNDICSSTCACIVLGLVSRSHVSFPCFTQLAGYTHPLSPTTFSKTPAPLVPCPPPTLTGSVLLLQDLLLLNVSLVNPNQGNPSTAFLPTSLALPPGALLKLRDVILVVTQETMQPYVAFLRSVQGATLFTDNSTFLHIRNYSYSPFAAVEAHSLTLVAPTGAAVRGTPLSLLRPFLRGSNGGSNGGCSADLISTVAQQQQVDRETVAAACGDSAGIINVTDSYVLRANNATLIPVLQQLASGVEDASRQPLLVIFGSNVTLSSRVWGRAWPAGGVVLRRPVGWVGSSSRPTSVDFGMEVGQVSLCLFAFSPLEGAFKPHWTCFTGL